ncbi:phosphatidate cytidylyltransferase [Mucilaginibacter arboris]|uniref:Phosphatidate cytidylyltransferase n=1 Tax=Mucilaginibacter arboris TaxID=2682090 RepID=A0A7K1SZ55_9SPHI|nr:phosphatidate cytidylyltransferase [Mucilaginibacter arboris]MVN22583.1 phosphatidate cytidylyltransferase [Mucilaginibacter arboris]
MKKVNLSILVVALIMVLSSCSVVGGIFKAGAAVGIIAVVVVILVLIWLISLFRGRSN